MNNPKALIICYSDPNSENRLKTQVEALALQGFEIDTLGWPAQKLRGVANHIAVPRGPWVIRVGIEIVTLLLFKPARRFKLTRLPNRLLAKLDTSKYSLVINHDLEMIPAVANSKVSAGIFEKCVRQVDLHELHEYTPSALITIPMFGRYLERRHMQYQNWLMSHLKSKEIDLFTIVGDGISKWYSENYSIERNITIRNAAPYRKRNFESRSSPNLRFVHHGKYSKNRGLENLVEASLGLRQGDTLTFILTGDEAEIEKFRLYSLDVNSNIRFMAPVSQEKVSSVLAQFDVEVVFFAPVTQNLLHTLPNKVFEAVQADLALVAGPNPDLARLIRRHKIGRVLGSWSSSELKLALASFDRNVVEAWRVNANRVSRDLSAEREGMKLTSAWKKLLVEKHY